MRTVVIRIAQFAAPVIIGIAVLVFAATNRAQPQRKPPAEQARSVRTIEAVALPLVPRLLAFGSVQPARVFAAVAQVSGEVEYLDPAFDRGALLAAGTEIVRISPVDYELAIAQAQANLRAADARIAELSVSEQNTRETLALDERALALRETERQRVADLRRNGALPQSALDAAVRDALAQRKLVQALRNTLRLLPTQLEVQRQQRAVYAAQLESARLDLARTRIRLPFDARIVEAKVEAMQFVQAGQTVAIADGLDVAEIVAEAPVARLAGLLRAALGADVPTGITPETFKALAKRMDLRATVRLAANIDGPSWHGRLDRTSDALNPQTRSVGLIVSVDDPYGQAVPGKRPPLTKGMFVEVELRVRSAQPALVVPRAAVHDNSLYIVDAQGRLEIRPVELGLRQGAMVAVSDGLAAGERVVVSDLVPALPGMLLVAQPDDALAARLRAAAAGEGRLR